MSSAGSSVKKATKRVAKDPLKTGAALFANPTLAQGQFVNRVTEEGFRPPPALANQKGPGPEERRKRQVLRAREEVLQQRRRAPGRTQTILTRREG